MWPQKTIKTLAFYNQMEFFLLLILNCLIGACVENERVKTGGPYYYETAEMKQQSDFPLRPVRILKKNKIANMRAFGIVYYDDHGRINSYTKILDEKEHWSSKFYYSPEGYLEKEEYLSPDKKLILKYYDKHGKLIRSEENGS